MNYVSYMNIFTHYISIISYVPREHKKKKDRMYHVQGDVVLPFVQRFLVIVRATFPII